MQSKGYTDVITNQQSWNVKSVTIGLEPGLVMAK